MTFTLKAAQTSKALYKLFKICLTWSPCIVMSAENHSGHCVNDEQVVSSARIDFFLSRNFVEWFVVHGSGFKSVTDTRPVQQPDVIADLG
jgi:hypothetical protein